LAKEIGIFPLPTGSGFFMVAGKIKAYILAGGSSRRMGTDKLFLKIDDRSLLERTISTCEFCFENVKLVAGNPARFSSLGIDIVPDSPAARGPMAGVIAALEDSDRDICFVTAADLPDLSRTIIESLIARYSGQQYFGLMEPGGLQPLCGIYSGSSLDAFYRFAREGNFSVAAAVESLNYEALALPSVRWRNINYPGDLAPGERDG
jgi:molybdopterin-guanine dinucleotide biosynthesis protein A